MKKYISILFVIVMVLTGCLGRPIPAPDFSDPENAFPAELIAKIDTHVAQKLDSLYLAGMVVAVNDGQRPVFIKGYGYADIEAAEITRPNTVYNIGSIAKTFTAVAVMKLAEEKELALDDPVTRFFPDLPGTAAQMTVRQLLSHTSGLPGDERITGKMDIDLYKTYTSDDLYALFVEVFSLFDTLPGQAFEYSNAGYILLSLIIEQVSGMSYGDYLTRTIFEPLGLTSTVLCKEEPEYMAKGYERSGGESVPAKQWNPTLYSGAGNICSSAPDLILWMHAVANGQIIKTSSYKEMIKPTDLPDGIQNYYGLGMQLYVSDDYKTIEGIGHTGGLPGFRSILRHYIAQNVTIVIITNSTPFLENGDSLYALSRTIQWRHEQQFGSSH